MGASGQRHAPAALYSRGKDPRGTHWIGGWVGPRAGLTQRLEEKSSASVGDRIIPEKIPVMFMLTDTVILTTLKCFF
jgi:hypothetical protein